MRVRSVQLLTTHLGLRAALAVTVTLLASAAVSAMSHPPAQARCAAEEGAAVATRFGLEICDGAAATTVITHEEPQRGARVAAVDPGGLGAREGLVAGDIIYQVAGRRVASGRAAIEALDAVRDERIVHINFWRNGAPFIARIWTR
jgi:S1-C subfamily serine protease